MCSLIGKKDADHFAGGPMSGAGSNFMWCSLLVLVLWGHPSLSSSRNPLPSHALYMLVFSVSSQATQCAMQLVGY